MRSRHLTKSVQRRRAPIGVEVDLLGCKGLEINDPAKQYKLKKLPANFSDLNLFAIMYAAFQQIDPSADLGTNFFG